MESSQSEGLGLSLALFMGAILGVLALLAVPVWLAARPVVYDNPVLAKRDPLLNGPIVGHRDDRAIPLAMLKHQQLIDPKVVAALNAKLVETKLPGSKLAKADNAERPESHRPARRTAERNVGTPVAQLQPERRERSGFFLFNLFGG